MDWRDTGFVLTTRRHGESALIVELLTEAHGRHAGLVRGGQSPRRRALLQPGNLVAMSWRGRLPEHLGAFEIELLRPHAAGLIDDPDRLAALSAAAALVALALPEREPQRRCLSRPCRADHRTRFCREWAALAMWPGSARCWPRLALASISAAARATGVNDDLAYVSPRSGRAVSRSAGVAYHDKLLTLPGFLWRDTPAESADILAGLVLAGYFLHHHLLEPQGRALPEARTRLAERLRRLV